jgi:hypothetical protein
VFLVEYTLPGDPVENESFRSFEINAFAPDAPVDTRARQTLPLTRPIGLIDRCGTKGNDMRVAKDDVDVKMDIPGAKLRQRTEFGTVKGYDKISGEYFSLAEGVDTTPLFQGLAGGVCDCPHWGFVLRGRLTTTDAKGVRETVNANDLFYWPPGHNVKVEADAEIVMFSPQHEHTRVIDHMREKTKG